MLHHPLPSTSKLSPKGDDTQRGNLVGSLSVAPLSQSVNHPTPSPPSDSPYASWIKPPRRPFGISSHTPFNSIYARSGSTTKRSTPTDASLSSRTIDDILTLGDVVGEGCSLQGECIRLVPVNAQPMPVDCTDGGGSAHGFEVIRRLGSSSSAVVYLVKEVLSRPLPPKNGHMSTVDSLEFDGGIPCHPETMHGRDYAIMCLPKVNFKRDPQLVEVRLPFFPLIISVQCGFLRTLLSDRSTCTSTQLALSTGLLRPHCFYFFSWNTFLVKISSTL